ncbi:hypothetical protein DFR70_105172 [Nocardia tenerifensis]|uniref:DUF6194 domain-containing protein n=1 Tax=Nocardia tenerifensis TaxID=228006 RepID=A0A318K4E8_9NOCA|nr:DUF6194 family protein [Nocardia tenerifensis]PXX63990.1 hypothetical protein DFR70_105172 [Nocardia tenerifensis]
MTIDEIKDFIADLDGVLTLSPTAGDPWPAISHGDSFFYYSPDGAVPTNTQPFATIVTKDYPNEPSSGLDRPNTFRVNIAAGKEAFTDRLGHAPRHTADVDYTITDTVIPHPTYATAGWLSVVNPGPHTDGPIRELLQIAYQRARSRYERHAG